MSMNLSIYVGPYLEVDRAFELSSRFNFLVADGRCEAAVPGEPWRLIPNQTLPGVERQLSFDRYDDPPVVPITEAQISAEKVAIFNLTEHIFDYCREHNIRIQLLWGVVPCWS